MILLNGPEKWLALLFLLATTFHVGLGARPASFAALLASPGRLARTLGANFVVVPLLGLALARALPLPPASAAAIVLLACVPGGLGSIQFTSHVQGEEVRAGATLVLLNVLAILVSPGMLRLALPAGADLALPYGPALAFLAACVLLPMGAGVVVHEKAPRLAPRLAPISGLVGVCAFVAFMVVSNSVRREAVAAIGGPAVGAMAVLILGAMALGWWLGGPARGTRQLLANATSMRNAALCLAVALNSPGGAAVMTPLVAFSLLMVPPNLLFSLYGSLRARREARRGGAPPRGRASWAA